MKQKLGWLLAGALAGMIALGPWERSSEAAIGPGTVRITNREVKVTRVDIGPRGNSPPRYMQRLRQIETEFGTQCRRLLAAYEALLEAHGDDAETFARRWQSRARSWRFDRLNDLVREHNAWYPIEANLPMDPRTRNFIPVRGGSYRRVELGAEWVLEHLPARPTAAHERPELPRRAPREPLAPRPTRSR